MTIAVSFERFTGRGAAHFTEVLTPADVGGNGEWVRLTDSYYPSERVGRERGFEVYCLELSEGERVRAYHRSNTGIERVDEDRVAGPDGDSVTVEEGESAARAAFPHKF